MTAIAGSFVFVLFFLVVWLIFGGLLDTVTDQTDSIRASTELH